MKKYSCFLKWMDALTNWMWLFNFLFSGIIDWHSANTAWFYSCSCEKKKYDWRAKGANCNQLELTDFGRFAFAPLNAIMNNHTHFDIGVIYASFLRDMLKTILWNIFTFSVNAFTPNERTAIDSYGVVHCISSWIFTALNGTSSQISSKIIKSLQFMTRKLTK